jgi:Domain of unknown function (DUF4157)
VKKKDQEKEPKKGLPVRTASPSSDSRVSSSHPILDLQKSVGNQAVLQLLNSSSSRGDSDHDNLVQSLGPEQPLDSATRASMESGLGHRFGDVRIHAGEKADKSAQSVNARAFSVGNHIAFAAGEYKPGALMGETLLAHELAHVVQQRGAGPETFSSSGSDAALEHDANSSASFVGSAWARTKGSLQSFAHNTGPRLRSGLQIQRCSTRKPDQDLVDALDSKVVLTPALAIKALDYYRGLAEGDKAALFTKNFPTGRFQALVRTLPPDAAAGPYNDVLQDILRRVQRAGALESAKASGLADESAMAHTQANFMDANNKAAAAAAKPVGVPPTPAEIAAQQAKQVEDNSIPDAGVVLTAAEEAMWTTKANAAVGVVVTYATAHHPELKLTAADINVDVKGVEARGAGVIAYGEKKGGKNVATVGRTFARYVEKNPAYAMSVIVHEIHGHPEYGVYGASGAEYGLELYDKSAKLMPGYTQPVGKPRTKELDNFGYQETEIYSLLKSLTYHTPLAAADAGLQGVYVDPEPTVRARIAIIKKEWEPKVAKALLRGLYMRFRNDPTLKKVELEAFERSVRANFTGAETPIADDILKI